MSDPNSDIANDFESDHQWVKEAKKELTGRKCRVIRPGDLVTQDYMPARVNIHLDKESVITDVTNG